MRLMIALLLIFSQEVQDGPRLSSVRIEEPFEAVVYYTPDASIKDARLIIYTEWAEIGPDPVVAVLNHTTDRASAWTMPPREQRLTLWLDWMFPKHGDLKPGEDNEFVVEIVSSKGALGRSTPFRIALK